MKLQQCLWAVVFSVLLLFRASAATLYVSMNSANPVPPYADWSTASTNIQDAINAASTGDTVLVNDGIYDTGGETVTNSTVTNRVVVNKVVTVQSLNGPNATLIDGDRAMRCVFLASGAKFCGFTLSSGSASAETNAEGGGVYCESASSTVSNCVINGNFAEFFYVDTNNVFHEYGYGGGAFGGTLDNCTLVGNFADNGGGASACTLNNCTLSSNWAFAFGGGANECTLNNCTLAGNTAASGNTGSSGGASLSTLNNCTLTNNIGNDTGGGAGGCILNNCILIGNRANDTDGGGAIGCTLNNCVLAGNSAGFDGGGAVGCTLNNCTLEGNSAYRGGGAVGCTLNNCTVTGNTAYSEPYFLGGGGGAFDCTLYNCIVYYNTVLGDGTSEGTNYDSYCTLNYCCTTPLPPSGVGNITNEPLFIDFANGNLRLQPASPCINAGNNDYVSTTTDLDGNPRIVGGTVDMGAYEFWTPALLLERLIGLVNESGLRHQQPLLASLEAALASLHRGNTIAAANQLSAFQNKVRVQVGAINPELAQVLISATQQAIEVIAPNANP